VVKTKIGQDALMITLHLDNSTVVPNVRIYEPTVYLGLVEQKLKLNKYLSPDTSRGTNDSFGQELQNGVSKERGSC
jgi:hypothetical protein